MHLSAHHALWNSRKGAEYASSKILPQTKAQLEPMMGTIVPKIFLASRDPNQKVSNAMQGILSSLGGEKELIAKYWKEIMKSGIQVLICSPLHPEKSMYNL